MQEYVKKIINTGNSPPTNLRKNLHFQPAVLFENFPIGDFFRVREKFPTCGVVGAENPIRRLVGGGEYPVIQKSTFKRFVLQQIDWWSKAYPGLRLRPEVKSQVILKNPSKCGKFKQLYI
jgi:hypothetical protein